MANDNSDIKLTPQGVKIEGDTVIDGGLRIENGLLRAKVNVLSGWEFLGNPPAIILSATDLVLDNSGVQETKWNAALSHGKGDTLIINRGKGYQGGIKVEGKLRSDSNISAREGLFSRLQIGWDTPLTPHHEPYITIDQHSITAHNVKIDSAPLPGTGHSLSQTGNLDLIKEVLKMRKEIRELKAKVKALES